MNKPFLSLFLVFGLVFTLLSASSGMTLMQWPDSAYFLFSTGQTTSYDNAIGEYYDPIENFDISLEPWNEPAWCSNNIDMGAVSLDYLGDTPPTSGYSYESTGGYYDCDYVIQGHSYWIKTINGKYAKVQITNAVHLGSDPTYGNINKITFDWVYYGSSTSGGTKSDDNKVCGIPISLGFLAMLSIALKH